MTFLWTSPADIPPNIPAKPFLCLKRLAVLALAFFLLLPVAAPAAPVSAPEISAVPEASALEPAAPAPEISAVPEAPPLDSAALPAPLPDDVTFGVAPGTAGNVPAPYVPVLDSMHSLLARGPGGHDLREGEFGMMEAWAGREGPEALASAGWALLDLSGDGRPELLTAELELSKDGRHVGSRLYSVHTIRDGKAFPVLEGTARSAYALMEGGMLLHRGSASATMSIFGTCALTPDGSATIWRDYWFSMEKDAPGEIGFYQNESGKLDKEESREVGRELFAKALEERLALLSPAEFTPFLQWQAASAPSGRTVGPAVHLQWANAVKDDAIARQAVTVTSEQPQAQVAVCADRPVKNLKVLKLEFENVDAKGHIHFRCTELFHLETLEPGRPLLVVMAIPGSIPHYGLSYEDEQGHALRFSVTQNAQDGSLQLLPF